MTMILPGPGEAAMGPYSIEGDAWLDDLDAYRDAENPPNKTPPKLVLTRRPRQPDFWDKAAMVRDWARRHPKEDRPDQPK